MQLNLKTTYYSSFLKCSECDYSISKPTLKETEKIMKLHYKVKHENIKVIIVNNEGNLSEVKFSKKSKF